MMCYIILKKIIILILISFLFINNIVAEDIEKENEEMFEKLFGTPKELKTKRDYREIFENPFNPLGEYREEENSRIYAKVGYAFTKMGKIGVMEVSTGIILGPVFDIGINFFTIMLILPIGIGGLANLYLFDIGIIKPYVTFGMNYCIVDYRESGMVTNYGLGIKLNTRKIIENIFGKNKELQLVLNKIIIYLEIGYAYPLDFEWYYLPDMYYNIGLFNKF